MAPETARAETLASQTLERHRRRRGQGIPTLTVLAGPPGAGVPLWVRWTRQQDLPHASTRALTEAEAVREWLAALARGRDLAADAAAFLESRAGLAPGELASRIQGQTAYERRALLQGLLPPDGGGGPFAACRLLLDPAAPRSGPDLDALRTACGPEPARAVEALQALLPPGAAPALLFLGAGEPWLDRAARIAARLCATVPPLVVALAVDRRELDAWLGGEESQARAMVREGVVPLDAPPPEAVERRLEDLGVPEVPKLARSVARLAADGVPDEVLTLFGETARCLKDKEEGPRARSTEERFLFSLLDALPWSHGLFELNASPGLDFPAGRPMEVDLLSRTLRVAVELDGFHHFQGTDRYRTDRRKDLILQRHGYLVLRFLSEDVVVRLEEILNTLSEIVSLRRGPEGGLSKGHADDGGA